MLQQHKRIDTLSYNNITTIWSLCMCSDVNIWLGQFWNIWPDFFKVLALLLVPAGTQNTRSGAPHPKEHPGR